MPLPTKSRRVLTAANIASVAVAVVVFVVLLPLHTSTLYLVGAAILAALAGLSVWWLVDTQWSNEPVDPSWRGFVGRLAATTAMLLVLSVAIASVQVAMSWSNVDRAGYTLEAAQTALGELTSSTTMAPDESPVSTTTSLPPLPDETYRSVLLIGGDELSGNGDVILYLVLPTNDQAPFMMSFPRDLYVDNPCTGGEGRINVLAKGCDKKDINGGTLLSVQVSEMTGINVDHFATFDFAGFVEIIDAVDGIALCLEYPVRDSRAQLDLPAGCMNVDGDQALAWVRSRHTEEYRNGGWYSMPGASDLLRNEHQQDVILKLFQKLKRFDSPRQLANTINQLTDAFTLSDTIGATEAVALAWSLRDIELATIKRLEIPVRLTRSPTDQSILVATTSPRDVIEAEYSTELAQDGG
jgi:LCP family protein required for cell wall assembly